MKVIIEFRIALKLGYFMMDNTTNNNTLITTLLALLLNEYNIKYNAIYH